MKPQDLLVAIRLFIAKGKKYSYAELGSSLAISASEAHAAVQRLNDCYLFDALTNSIRKTALEEFLVHGLQYTFPVAAGKMVRGVLTGFSAPFFKNEFSINQSTEVFIWPFSSGNNRGVSIKPLYGTVPQICLKDSKMYHWLAIIDMLRLNRAREREVAISHLKKLL
jgi:hypothetical protein